MIPDLRHAVQVAQSGTPWDVGNQFLYDLCRKRPEHTDVATVIAKVWIIGRTYAAAIERRRNRISLNEQFYIKTVGPKIVRSNIDGWIVDARRYHQPNDESFATLMKVHYQVMQLFNAISGLNKRALASKYLHFHLPNLFYIYDSRAVAAMRQLGSIVGRVSGKVTTADEEYWRFASKCLRLQNHVEHQFGVCLTPRQLDNLLLAVPIHPAKGR